MFKTIKNDFSGIIHAVNDDPPERPVPYSICNTVGPYLGRWSIKRYEHKSMRDSMVTCKRCRTTLNLLNGKKTAKAKWIAVYLGDANTNGVGLADDWDDLEFEISVCRENYTDGIESAGWNDLHRKIVLFDSDDYPVLDEEDIEWMKQVAEATALGMNKKGL